MSLVNPYSTGAYNKFDDKEQWIRISEGCPNQCEYCYEPKEYKIYDIPEIVRNLVKIMDMNLLCKPKAKNIIDKLGVKRVDGKVVYYELICGIDYRFTTKELVVALKASRFKNIRIAWDWGYSTQFKIKQTIKWLIKAGYQSKDIMVFIICNWKIDQAICLKKLDLLKVWRVQVADCYFDNQLSPNIKPEYWTEKEIKEFRHKCRKHNQLVNFGIDPEADKVDTEPLGLKALEDKRIRRNKGCRRLNTMKKAFFIVQ